MHVRIPLAFLTVCCAIPLNSPIVRAADEAPTREVLELLFPTGETRVPVPADRDAAKGYIFNFDKQSFGVLPEVPANVAAKDQTEWLANALRTKKVGDIFYSVDAKTKVAVMFVISGKVRDLGKKYIFDFNRAKLDPPTEWPPVDAAKGVPVSGWVNDPQAGHVYLVETVNKTPAIFRIIAKGEGGMVIQWVAPGMTMTAGDPWDLPGSMPAAATNIDVAFHAPEARAVAQTRAAAPVAVAHDPGVVPVPVAATHGATPPETLGAIAYSPIRPGDTGGIPQMTPPGKVANILRERETAIVAALALMGKEIKTKKDRLDRAQTMIDLGQMGAVEAVDALVAQISFLDPSDAAIGGETLKMHPAVGALIHIGKPATAAALKAMNELKQGGNSMSRPEYRTTLLTTVIWNVEGEDVAEFLLKRELDKADVPHKVYFEQALREIKELSATAAGTQP